VPSSSCGRRWRRTGWIVILMVSFMMRRGFHYLSIVQSFKTPSVAVTVSHVLDMDDIACRMELGCRVQRMLRSVDKPRCFVWRVHARHSVGPAHVLVSYSIDLRRPTGLSHELRTFLKVLEQPCHKASSPQPSTMITSRSLFVPSDESCLK